MSDENNGASAPDAQKSSSEQMIPKSRFDEVIRQKQEAMANASAFQTMVQQMTNANNQRPKKEDPTLRKLREENPEMYTLYQRQQQELSTVRESATQLAEHQDKQEFFHAAGRNAQKYGDKIEAIVEAERRNGNYNVKRSAVYAYVRGQEAIQKDFESPSPTDDFKPTTQETVNVANDDAPGSRASSVAPRTASTAAVGGDKTREERIRDLSDFTF